MEFLMAKLLLLGWFLKVDYHSFPTGNRPIITTIKGGKMSYGGRNDDAFTQTAEAILQIMDLHDHEKGIILPYTNEIEERLYEEIKRLDPDAHSRLMTHTKDATDREEVLAEFEISLESTVERIRIGNINKTYFIYQGEKQYILQELNPIFNPAIHYDIVSVPEHLSAHGFLTPHIQKTRQNELWLTDSKGHVWRMYDYIVGHIHSRAPSSEICFEAGHLAGRFHTCLSRLEYKFQSNRLGVHDFNRHISHLKSVIETHKRHDAYDDVASLANKIISSNNR